VTAQTVECFHANQRVASHVRSPHKSRHTTPQRRDMLELLDDRYGNHSTLMTSQMPVDNGTT
jgi:hypothetical protein